MDPGMDTPQHSTDMVGGAAAGASATDPANELIDEEEPEEVAIKVISNFARDTEFLRRVWFEISILHAGQSIPQVIPLYNIERVSYQHNPAGQLEGQLPVTLYDLHLTMEYVRWDLASLIERGAVNTEVKIKSVICQLLLGIDALHRRKCLHRDLSSRNVLVTDQLSVFICDFGLARLYDPEEQMSYGVITQWYRAPEVLLDCKYGFPVDVWAVGVMMAELFMKKHLFKGRNKDVVHQLNCILEVLGGCPVDWLTDETKLGTASANASAYMRRQVDVKGTGLENLKFFVPCEGQEAVPRDLLSKLLCFDPSARITAAAALDHPWFQEDDRIKSYIDEQRAYAKTVSEETFRGAASEDNFEKKIDWLVEHYREANPSTEGESGPNAAT